MLADEPTGEVDRETAREVIALLPGGRATGGAVVIVTPQPRCRRDAADRVMRLVDGRVAE